MASVCDPVAEARDRVAATYGLPSCASWEEGLRQFRPRMVVICTPAPTHVPLALAALAAGCHVLIEKPLSHSLDRIEELLQACAVSSRQSAVAYVYHVHPVLADARTFLQTGALGKIHQVVAVAGQPFHRLRPGYASTYYRERNLGGGAIQDALTHVVNWVESVIGPADSLLCDCAHLVLSNVTVEDTVHISARHGDTLASYSLNQFQSPNETTIQFNAAGGSVRIEFNPPRWGFFGEKDLAWTWHDSPPIERDALFIAQANAFMDQIEGQPARLCTVAAAAETLRFNLAALASADTSRRVSVRDATFPAAV